MELFDFELDSRLESRFAFLHLRFAFRFDSSQCWILLHLIEEQLDEQGVSRVTYTELCAARPRAEGPAEADPMILIKLSKLTCSELYIIFIIFQHCEMKSQCKD